MRLLKSEAAYRSWRRVRSLCGQLEDSTRERAFQLAQWPEEARQTRIALGLGVASFMASLTLEYLRIGQSEAFFWSAGARALFLMVFAVALSASYRDKPGALMSWSLVATATAFALCGVVTILVGDLPWQDYAATTAMAMIYLAIFVPNRPPHAMLSVFILAASFVGLLFFVEGANNVARLVIVEIVVLITCLAAISHNARIRRAAYMGGVDLASTQESSRAELVEAEFQRQTFEEAAAEGVTLNEELVAAREDAERQSSFLRAVLDNIPQGVSVFDKELKLAAWNHRLDRMLNLPRKLLKVGTPLADIMLYNAERGEYGKGDPKEIVAARTREIASGQIAPHHYERRRPCGMVVEVRGDPMPGGGLVTTYADVTERRNAEEVIRKMALRDPLTGIANRNAFNQHLQAAIKEAGEGDGEFALALFDLDDFKPVNDRYGHPVGDMLLCHVARIIEESVRDEDVAARLGGDEFAIILKNLRDRGLAEELVRRIVEKLGQPVTLDGDEIRVGCSAGISIYPPDASTAEDLIRSADKALYAAKASGKNQMKLAAG
jgi:diguanylate cyclase (GGDEF)-like protein